ncbi:MAG TPA: UPF0182 family protein [Acidimicrobiales bacterium]|nr:UPF0182 family protein [Acidimicrobiales bacterium]
MRAPTDLPRRRRTRSLRVVLAIAAAVILLLIISLRGIAGFYTDYLWFGELNLTSVWKGILGSKLLLGAVFSVVFFVAVWANLAIADVIAPTFRPMGPEEQLVERYHAFVGSRAGLVRIGVAALLALIAGPAASGQWNAWVLFRNSVSFGIKDPQFHRDIGFFVFQLPFIKFVVDWLFAAVIIILVVTAVAHYMNGGIRFQTPMRKVTPQVKVHLSVLLAVLALLKAILYYLQRFELVYSSRGVVQGANYTDVKAQLPALNLLILISVLASLLFIVNIWRRGWVLPAVAVGVWALVSLAAGAAYPNFVQQFRVQPNESTKELPYIKRNIDATRAAFQLKDTRVTDFPYKNDLTAAGLAENQETIRNIRLWDPNVLLRTYKRLQEIRNYYQFNNVDIDRYSVAGRTTQILIAARELNTGGIPSPSWVNQHLVYTHGYAAAASPANAVAPDGNPDFIVKDLPPQGVPIERPEVYFGQNLGGYAIVKTGQKEVDYPENNGTNHTSAYVGKGGVQMNSLFKRAALALRFGEFDPLISGFVKSSSRAIYIRNIDDRVKKAAPFLRYDSDPYPVLVKGRIQWVYDAYTTTNRYPNSQTADTERIARATGLDSSFNYVRNSVKVVIDAYDGSMTYYVVDNKDPMIRAYQKAFPKLFTDGSKMDPELRAHLRYPEDLFQIQTNMYGLYHIVDANSFYSKTDAWAIAQAPPRVGNAVVTGLEVVGNRQPRSLPYYLLMRLPNEQKESFLMLQPFVPFSKDDSRKDLSAFMIAKSDPDDYGKLQSYVMPRQLQIDGPGLINARINQQPDISKDISLLNTQGSRIELGSLLLIPINNSILYVQPLYVSSDATPLPQLKRVIVVYSDKVVMRDSLREAMNVIFGAAPETLEQTPGQPAPAPGETPPTTPGTPVPPVATATVQQLIEQANGHFEAAQTALRNGDLSAYQRETDTARDLIRQASQALAGTGGPAGTTPPPTASTTPPPAASTTTTTRASA